MPPRPGVHLAKGFIDANFKKNLAELESHPALMERCKKFFTARVVYKLTLAQLATQEKVCIATVKAYVDAYRNILKKYWDGDEREDAVWAYEAQIARLVQLLARAEANSEKLAAEREIRATLSLLNELRGFVDRSPKIQINTVTQVVNVVDDCMREALQEMGLSEEKVLEVLRLAGEKIGKKVKNGNENFKCLIQP